MSEQLSQAAIAAIAIAADEEKDHIVRESLMMLREGKLTGEKAIQQWARIDALDVVAKRLGRPARVRAATTG